MWFEILLWKSGGVLAGAAFLLLMILQTRYLSAFGLSQEAIDDLKGKWRLIGLASLFLFVLSALLLCLGIVVFMFKAEGVL